MSKSNTNAKIEYIYKIYCMSPNYTDTVIKELLPILGHKKEKTVEEQRVTNSSPSRSGSQTKQKVQVKRTSKFLLSELQLISKMISGEHKFNLMEQADKHMGEKLS